MKRFLVLATILSIAALTLAVQFLPSGFANNNEDQWAPFTIINRDAVAYGKAYGDWSAAWNQWSYSIPEPVHPLFDNGDCSTAQSGPVWFLGGKFCANGETCSFTTVRTCTVPYGKALFFPVVDSEDSALEESVNEHPGDPSFQQIAAMRQYAAGIESTPGVFCEIDRKPVPQLMQRFGVQSAAFGFTLPDKNILSYIYAPPNDFKAGTYYPAVDEGYYIMLAPLPPGNHTLHFGASWLDVTYHLTVTK